MADNNEPILDDDQIRMDAASTANSEVISDELPKKPRIQLGPPVFGRWRLWIVVIPFIVYLAGSMVGGYVEDLRVMLIEGKINDHSEGEHRKEMSEQERQERYDAIPEDAKFLGVFELKEKIYPITYTVVISVTAVLVLIFGFMMRGYFKAPFRISIWSVLVGVVGVVVWVGLVKLDQATFNLGAMSSRTAYNPFEELKGSPNWMWTFFGIRFFGLVMIIPLVEEFFIRGFLMRYVDDPDWDEIPLGIANIGGWVAPTVYGVIAHAPEPLAALAWFSMVTWVYKKTGSIWDCVVAHAITNLLLGLYIVRFNEWSLW